MNRILVFLFCLFHEISTSPSSASILVLNVASIATNPYAPYDAKTTKDETEIWKQNDPNWWRDPFSLIEGENNSGESLTKKDVKDGKSNNHEKRFAIQSIFPKPFRQTDDKESEISNNTAKNLFQVLFAFNKNRSIATIIRSPLGTFIFAGVMYKSLTTSINFLRVHLASKNVTGTDARNFTSSESDRESEEVELYTDIPDSSIESHQFNQSDTLITEKAGIEPSIQLNQTTTPEIENMNSQVEDTHENQAESIAGETKENNNHGPMHQIFGVGRETKKKIEKLQREVEVWQERAEQVEAENKKILNDSKRINNELQEYIKENLMLESNMKILKTQLAKSDTLVGDAISKERKKSEQQMAKVRDALLKVIQQERTMMKEQMQKTSAEVRAMIVQKNSDSDELISTALAGAADGK